MKIFLSIVGVIIIIGLASTILRSPQPAASNNVAGLQQCPDERIDNQMPGPGGAKPSYYILKGERREISEFDGAWVAANCNVPSQTVY